MDHHIDPHLFPHTYLHTSLFPPMRTLMPQAKKAHGVLEGDEPDNWSETPEWPVQDLQIAIGLSGPYNMVDLLEGTCIPTPTRF